MYICSICKTPTPREGHCDTCGWVKTIIIKENVEVKGLENFVDLGHKSVAMITEDTQHVTGGRYYSWWIATALQKAGFNVTIYTNRVPVFIDSFKEYPQPNVQIVKELNTLNVKADFYVGSPIVGSEIAIRLANQYRTKAFCEIFDPFPMMEEYRGKHYWPGWDNLIEQLKQPNVNIISLCKHANGYIYPWLNKREDQVFEVYPCINSKARDKSIKKVEKMNWVTFISRLDFHKKFDHVLEAVSKTNCRLQVITSIDGINYREMLKKYNMEKRTDVHMFISDEEKFDIIAKSKVTINGAIFEGFGMWLVESLACGVPCVCYDYPIFKEIVGQSDMVYMAEWNNPEDLTKKLKLALKEKKSSEPYKNWDFESMVKRMSDVLTQEPKIGVVQIALNEEKFIQASLKSVIRHKNIKRVVVVEGCVRLNEHSANDLGLSKDNTRDEVIKAMQSEYGHKIVYERYGWAKDKSETRNRALTLLKDCDYIMVLDADELWKQEDLDLLMKFIKNHPDVSLIWYPAYHFWKQKDLLAVGSQWEAPLFRFFKFYDKTLHWDKHNTPTVNKDGISVEKLGGEVKFNKVHFYHYGPMKDQKDILDKLKYYATRDKDLTVKDTWTNWKKGQETSWTHQGGTVKKFEGTHPDEIEGVI